MQARLAEIQAAYPIMSVNELRERYFQLPPVEWGDAPVSDPHPKPRRDNPPLNLPPTSQGETSAAKSAIEAELAQWERFALNRLGRGTARGFEVRALPDELAFEVAAGLAGAGDRDGVRAVFAGVLPQRHGGTEG